MKKLTFADLAAINEYINTCIITINKYQDAQPHLSKLIGFVLLDVSIKIQRKQIGFIPPKGYRIKLKQTELAALYHTQNEIGLTCKTNALFVLLSQNN